MQSHAAMTEDKLAKIQERQARLARIKQIHEQNEVNASLSWYALAWNFCVSIAVGIQEGFKQKMQEIPLFEFLFPDNPGKKELLASLFFSSWSFLLKIISPVALAFSWVNTALAFKRLWEAENRTVWAYASAFFSLATSVTWTVLFALGAAGAMGAVASVLTSLPYLLPSILGGYALVGLFNSVRNCVYAFRAWKAGNIEECKAYAFSALKSLVSVVTNTFLLVASVFLGVKMQEAADLMTKHFFQGTKAISYCFDVGSKWLYAAAISVTVGAVMSTTKMNSETGEFIRHPVNGMKKAWYAIKANPFIAVKELVLLPVKLPLRMAAFIFIGPIHGLVKIIGIGLSRAFKSKPKHVEPTPEKNEAALVVEKPVIRTPEVEEKTVLTVTSSHKIEHKLTKSGLSDLLQSEVSKMDNKYPEIEYAPSEIQAERFQLGHLSHFLSQKMGVENDVAAKKYDSVYEIEKDAKAIARYSFFGGEKVQQLTKDVHEATRIYRAAPAA